MSAIDAPTLAKSTDDQREVDSAPSKQPAGGPPQPKTWLFGPLLDAVFISNLCWPLMVGAILYWQWPVEGATDPNASYAAVPLSFLQIYFISSPHRWITLLLVFCDPDRFHQESRKFVGYGFGLIAGGLFIAWLGTRGLFETGIATSGMATALGTLSLFMMIDYVWNAWHFAAQHAGIAAIYRRVGRMEKTPKQVEFEMSGIRLVVLWVFLRFGVYLALMRYPDGLLARVAAWLPILDAAAGCLAVVLLVQELRSFSRKRVGRAAYVVSVLSLYLSQLAALQTQNHGLIKGLFYAQAIFHATEYLSVVNWSVQKRRSGIWKYNLARGGVGMAVFVVVIGIGNWTLNHQSAYLWGLITLLVSLLHYGYDGMIWKSKRNKKLVTGSTAASSASAS